MSKIKPLVLVRDVHTQRFKLEVPAEPVHVEPQPPAGSQKKTEKEGAQAALKAAPLPQISRPDVKKTKEDGSSILAKRLGPQLASAPKFLAAQDIDERKLAVLNDYTQTAYGYFAYRGAQDNVRFWAYFVDWELTSSQGLNALARRHMLQAIANSAGVSVQQTAERPNILARNVWRRDWKEDAVKEGKGVPE